MSQGSLARRSPLAAGALTLAIALAMAMSAGAAWATQQIKVTPVSKSDLERLRSVAPEAQDCGSHWDGASLSFAADPSRVAALREAGFDVQVTIPDLEAYYLERMAADRVSHRAGGDGQSLQGNLFGAYHTYTEAIQAMDDLQAEFPALMTPKFSIGNTLEGRPIYVYKISDFPMLDEDEPEVFFNAYIHAREAITFEIVYDLAQTLLEGYDTNELIPEIVNNREIFILPCVNPDGVEYNATIAPGGGGMWRKNRRVSGGGNFGVDLNRNWGHDWGYDNEGSSPDPSSDLYRGTGPFSEPETDALRQFVNARQFKLAVNYHSYSNLHIFSFGNDNYHAPDYDALLAAGQRRRVDNNYNTGAVWEILYKVNGDANDWMYGEQNEHDKIFAYVTEVGTIDDGFWPLESRIPTLVQENLQANLRFCDLADNPCRALRPNIAAVSSPDTVGTSFTLTFTEPHPDPDNPAVSWNLIEAVGPLSTPDDVEGTKPSRWSSEGWAVSTARSHTATHSWYAGNHDNMNNTLTSLRGHLVKPGESLKFWTWHRIETGWDYGYVEVGTNGRDFTPIAGSITTNSDPNGANLGNGITGNRTTWTQATFDLSAYVNQVIWLRFRYCTDGGTANEGWYVDDVEPADLFTFESTVANHHPSAQFTFNGHASGNFSYLLQAIDAEGDLAPMSAPRKIFVSTTTDVAIGHELLPWRGVELAGANPFSGSARLQFQIPPSARVGEPIQLTVHDVSGRLMATLASGKVGDAATQVMLRDGISSGGPGSVLPGAPFAVRWSPEAAASGIYFARLVVGGRASEARLVLLD